MLIGRFALVIGRCGRFGRLVAKLRCHRMVLNRNPHVHQTDSFVG